MNEMTETQLKIISQIYKAFEKLGAESDILAMVGSWGDTLPDDEILEMFRQHNKTGTIWKEIIADVNDTPQDRRSRMGLVKCVMLSKRRSK